MRIDFRTWALAACLAVVSGCSSQKVDAVSNIAPAVNGGAGSRSQPDYRRKARTVPAGDGHSRAEVSELIANGSVAPDVSRTVPVNALTSGRVIEIHARLGDEVKKGNCC